MKNITLSVAELRPALAGLGKVISKCSALAILGNVRVCRHETGNVDLTVTDLDHSATCTLPSRDNTGPSTLLVPFEDLSNIVKTCGSEDRIELAMDGENIATIRFPVGGQEMEHHCDSALADEFPSVPEFKGDCVVLNDSVVESIHHAIECSSTDPTRAILQGAFLDVRNKGAHYVVGTDGKHLFSANSFSLPLADSVIIPQHKFLGWKGFNQDGAWKLRSLATKDDGVPLCELSTDHWRFVSRSVDGQYPNWKQVIPGTEAFKTKVAIEPDKLDQVNVAVQRLPIYDDRYQTIGLRVADKRFSLLGRSKADVPWTQIQIEDAACSGPDITILIDKRMLLKALRFGLSQIEFIDEMSPIKFSLAGRTLIVMPLRPHDATVAAPPTSPPPAVPVAAQPNSPQTADKPEPTQTMQTKTANGQPHPAAANGSTTATHNAPAKDESKSALETALVQIEAIRTAFRESINGLTKLGDTIRAAMREQKASEKEVQNVRQTLRSLQSVRI